MEDGKYKLARYTWLIIRLRTWITINYRTIVTNLIIKKFKFKWWKLEKIKYIFNRIILKKYFLFIDNYFSVYCEFYVKIYIKYLYYCSFW